MATSFKQGDFMQIVLSTRNPSKAEQAKAVFAGSGITILTLDEAGIKGQGIEDGDTLLKNATKKALFAHRQCPDKWAMADDTGLFITALSGFPGVETANWNGGNTETAEITDWILQQMLPHKDRSAKFTTVVAVVAPQGGEFFFVGEVSGVLLHSPRTRPQPNMPYSSIFKPHGSSKVWAEMTVEEENKISHRGKAFRKALKFLTSHNK